MKLSHLVTSKLLFCAAFSFAAESSETIIVPASKSVRWIQPCRSWQLNQNGHGYSCIFLDTSFDIPDAAELDVLKQRIATLEAQISSLTERVASLENGELVIPANSEK